MNTLSQLPQVDCKPVILYDDNGKETGITYVPAIIVDMDADLKKELRNIFASIYTKHHKEYCLNNPHGDLVKFTTQNHIDPLFDEILDLICCNFNGMPDICPLLDMINAKIKELEGQA